MTNLILIRGPAAVGKTTITRELVKLLKSPAHISEDHYRGYLQVKNGEQNQITYKNSRILIQTLIDKLTEIDSYENIVIEGLFPDEKVLKTYFAYAKKKKFKIYLFQLQANKNTLVSRNKIERGHIVRDSAIEDHLKLYKNKFKQATVLKNEESVEKIVNKIISYIK